MSVGSDGPESTASPENAASPESAAGGAAGTPPGRTGAARSQPSAATYFFGALGGLLFGYDLGVVAGALLLIDDELGLSALQKGFITSSLLVGAMIGALSSGRLAERFGRRGLVLIAGAVFAVGCVIAATAPGLSLIIGGRFIMGLAVGALSMTVPIYLAEISPARARGALSGLNQLMISSGILVAYLVNLALDGTGEWRIAFALALVPTVLLLVGVYFQPESPRWLMKQGRESEARAILARRGDESDVDRQLAEIREVLGNAGARRKVGALLSDKRMRRVLVIGVGVAFLQQVIGINTIIYYAPTILKQLGFANSAALLANAGLGALTVVVTVIMLLLVDRIGRRRPLIAGAVGMAVCMAALGTVFVVGGAQGKGVGGGAAGWIAIAALALFKVSFSLSWGGMGWIVLGEVFPLNVREAAMSVATFANWTGNFLVGLLFPVLLVIGPGEAFYLFAVIGVLAAVFAYLLVPETKGKSLETIERELVGIARPARA